MNEDSLNRIFSEYLPKVVRLAEYNIAPGMKHRIEADDIGATVFRTVFRRISEGKFRFEDEESFWKQLVVITLNRLANKVRDGNAQKRGGGKTKLSIEDLIAIASDPDPSHAAALSEVISIIADQLDETGRRILELRMAEYTYVEISEELGVTPKTVQRRMDIIRDKLSLHFPEYDGDR